MNGTKVEVVRYRSTKDYERDAQRRVIDGWTVQAQSQETGRDRQLKKTGVTDYGCLWLLFGWPIVLLGALIRAIVKPTYNKRLEGPITVTWVRS